MKKYFFTVFFIFFVYNLQSQVLIALLLGDKLNTGKIEFGLDGGVNFSNISNLETDKYLRAWNLGFYFDIKMKDQLFFNTGVLVKSSVGTDNLTQADLEFLGATVYEFEVENYNDGDYSQKINYFLVPALLKYKFKNQIHVEAGPQFGLMYNAWIEYNYNEDSGSGRIKEDNKDDVNRFDVGLVGGVGYRFLKGLGWTVGVRYQYGLTNVYKDISGKRNNSLYLKLNIPFGISDEKKDEIKEMKTHLQEKKEEKKAARKKKKKENKISNND